MSSWYSQIVINFCEYLILKVVLKEKDSG